MAFMTAIFRALIPAVMLAGAKGSHDCQDCNRPWPDLELFVPVNLNANIGSRISEWSDIFLKSFLLFWPYHVSKTKIRLVIDGETVNTTEHKTFSSLVESYKPFNIPRGIQVTSNDIPPHWYRGNGYLRQQLLMFYADNYTDAEYIGFGDTDCQFITYVDREDIFEDGKPVINGRIGKTGGWWWNKVPRSTQWLMGGVEEPMRCMSYFPVVVKTSHMKLMREYFFKAHNTTIDDPNIFRKYMAAEFSQFNGMCAYLWHFHREEYTWYTHDTEPQAHRDRSRPIHRPLVGQIKSLSNFTDDMFRPKPRVAIHSRYHNFRKPIIEEGYCRSPPFPKRDPKIESHCAARYLPYENGSIFDDMHSFEDGHYYALVSQSSLISEQSLRHERIKHCNHTWNKDLFLALVGLDVQRGFRARDL
jgi:hypothetical protein